ncbi:pectin lyase-like protein [Thozetella sp. PMI_491]|nr:pectin lyase-like protein [Thozetella sp. PMI_491]
MANISRSGSWPWGSNAAGFKVYRNVKDYGAKGDGVTDDTQAIMNAVKDFNACGPGCYSSTTKGSIIYFPAGTYLVSSTIETYYGTQFIGDATNRPTIKAAASFVGLGVLSTDHYVDGGGLGVDGNAKEWYINTSVFYRQIRNFIIDIRNTDQGAFIAALHYQASQATSLQFVDFISTTSATTTQQGIWIENGSGGFMADLTFTGGAFGIYGGNQQFTSQRITFTNVRTAVQLTWDWGWAWKSINIVNCGVGFNLMSENNVKNTGSLMVSDSVFTSTTTAILTFPFSNATRDTTSGITLDNVKFNGVTNGVWDGSRSYLAGSTANIDTWVQGRVYSGNTDNAVVPGAYSNPRDSVMVGANPNGLPKAPYFERAKPQYETVPASSFIHMKSSCKGDGVTDDTSCFQAVLNSASTSSIVFVDAGTYMISNTITVPKNIRIVGEVWAQVAAYGSNFGNSKAPKPLFQVGLPGDVGNVEIQDLLFTSKGNTPGLVFVEWNVRAASAGSAAMWDCHVRVGGALGTDLESKNCPALTSGTNANCNGGSAMMHITSQASGYFENAWLWVADHDLDDPDWNNDNNFLTQCSVYVGRGLLVESVNPVWLYGTASEHSVMYQYQFNNAAHVYATMIQTETPYYQPNPKPPAPVSDSVGVFAGDPDYTCSGSNTLGCDAAWALRILGSNSITIHGAGLYSWFSTYTQACVDTTNCQSNMIQFKDNTGNVRVHNLVTIGSVNMIQDNNSKQIAALDNLAVNFSPYMANIAVYDAHKL